MAIGNLLIGHKLPPMLHTYLTFNQPIKLLAALTFCILLNNTFVYGQENSMPSGAALEKVILEKDSIFWEAYNNCDVETMMSFIADGVEFYHDIGGLTEGKDNLNDLMKTGLCRSGKNEIERQAAEGSIQVFPLAGVGAIIKGQHNFLGVARPGENGTAYFFHLWEKRAEGWKMTRVFSYDHQPLPANEDLATVKLTPAQLERLTGVFSAPQTGTVVIEATDTGLHLIRGERVMQLEPKSSTTFFDRMLPLEFVFTLDENQERVLKFSVYQSGDLVEEAEWVKENE